MRLVVGDATYFGHVDSLEEPRPDSSSPSRSPGREVGDCRAAGHAGRARRGSIRSRRAAARRGRAGRRRSRCCARCDETARAAGAEITQVSGRLRREPPHGHDLQLRRPRHRRRPHPHPARRAGGRRARRSHRERHRDARRPRRLRTARRRPERVAEQRGAQGADRARRRPGARPARCRSSSATASAASCCTRRSVTGSRPTPSRRAPASTPGKLGEQLAPAFVNAYDDGRLPGEWGTDGIDDEGMPTQKIPILQDGVLASFLLRPRSAQSDGVALDRQRPARVLPPPAGPAHDQHLLRSRRRARSQT